MAAVRLVTVGNDHQVAVLTTDFKLGVCGKGETHLWMLDSYDTKLHNAYIYGLTFLSDSKTLVAWTSDKVLAWTVDIKARTSQRISDADFDVVTSTISTIVSDEANRIVTVEHISSKTHIVSVNDNTLTLHTIDKSNVSSVSFPISPEFLVASVLDESRVLVRKQFGLFLCSPSECKRICDLTHSSLTLARFSERLFFVDSKGVPAPAFFARYGFEDDSICGPVTMQEADPSTAMHMKCVGTTLVVVQSDGSVTVRKVIGLKGAPQAAWTLNLSHVQSAEEAQLQLIADAEAAEQKKKEQEAEIEVYRRSLIEQGEQVKKLQGKPNPMRREMMLGVPSEPGQVSEWDDVEPHHFRSAPAVFTGLSLGGGFLPPTSDSETQQLRQDMRELKDAVAALVNQMKQLQEKVL